MKRNMRFLPVLGAVLLFTLGSCSAVYEDLEQCPDGVRLHLTYTRNLLGADAYASAVHCSHVHIYDEKGEYLSTATLNGADVDISLPAGKYHAIAYGGMECAESTFAYNDVMGNSHHYSDLETSLTGRRSAAVPEEISEKLHPQFHGAADFEVEEEMPGLTPATIDLTKNTNNIRIVLQHSDRSSIDVANYKFRITADNSTMNHANEIIPQGKDVVYHPYIKDNMLGGFLMDGTPVETAFAEITMGRLTDDYSEVLHVETLDGTTIINTPILKYIELIKRYELADVSMQDYLDCQDSWTLIFTLDPRTEQRFGVEIKVNDWTVVYNEFEF